MWNITTEIPKDFRSKLLCNYIINVDVWKEVARWQKTLPWKTFNLKRYPPIDFQSSELYSNGESRIRRETGLRVCTICTLLCYLNRCENSRGTWMERCSKARRPLNIQGMCISDECVLFKGNHLIGTLQVMLLYSSFSHAHSESSQRHHEIFLPINFLLPVV